MGFDVDPENLRANGAAIGDTHAGAAADVGRLHGETEAGEVPPWGTTLLTDVLIGALYRELTSLTGEALELVGGGLEHSRSGLRGMADAYEHADNEAGGVFDRIGDGPA
ncbi:hypothetical protein [Actinophytocola sediminis]